MYPQLLKFWQTSKLDLLFWASYLALQIYFEYAWVHSSMKELPYWKIFAIAATSELGLLPAKIALIYVIFWLFEQQEGVFKGKFIKYLTIFLSFCFAVLAYRITIVYLLFPMFYADSPSKPQLFTLARINSTLTDFFFIIGLFIAFKQYVAKQAQEKYAAQLQKEKLTAELQFLRNQTNPHFLFNTLNNIYALARKKSEQTPEIILKLSQLLRFMLYECRLDEIPIANEIKIIEDYISLETIRYQDRLEVSFVQELTDNFEPIAPLLLLPFVENAFKHGAGESRFGAFIHLNLSLKDGNLLFVVENSKENTETVLIENIGLGNVRRQLELIYSDFDLKIDNQVQQFCVTLWVDLRKRK